MADGTTAVLLLSCDDQKGLVAAVSDFLYRHNGNITHSGIVTGIDANGNVTEVCSKWGTGYEYRHKPDEVPQGQQGVVNGRNVTRGTYGTTTVYRKP